MYVYACLYTICMPYLKSAEEREPLELELEQVVSCHVGCGNQTQVL